MILNLSILFILDLMVVSTFLGYGIILSKILFNKSSYSLHEDGFLGIAFLFIIVNLLHFIFPITELISIFIVLIGLSFFILNILRKNIKLNLKFLLSFLIFYILSITNNFHDDAYWYQIPYINYYQNYKIIYGINNFNFFYYGNSLYEIMSLFNLPNLYKSSLYIIPTSIIFFIFFFILEELDNKKNLKIFFIYLIFLSFMVLYRYTRSKEYGADLITMTYMFLVVYYFSKYLFLNNDENYYRTFIFFIFSIFSKVYSVFIIFFPVYLILFRFNDSKKFFKNKKIIIFFVLLITVPTIKNFIHSSCLYYPIKYTCIKTDWYMGDTNIKNLENFGSAISKGYKNYIYENKNLNKTPEEFLKNYRFNYKYLFKDKDIERILILLIILFVSFFIYFKKSKLNNTRDLNSKIILFLSSLTFFFWITFLPQSRYGGNIVVLIFLGSIFNFILPSFNFKINNFGKIFFIISLCFLIFKNFIRINNEINSVAHSYKTYPFDDLNLYKFDTKKINNLEIVVSKEELYCVNHNSLCTVKSIFKAIEDIRIKNNSLVIVSNYNLLNLALKEIQYNHKKTWINYK